MSINIEKKADDAAARWVARQMSGEMTPALDAEFHAWLKEGDNQQVYHEMVVARDSVDTSKLLADEFEADLVALDEQNNRVIEQKKIIHPWMKIAAGFVMMIGVGTILSMNFFDQSESMTFTTARGESSDVSLSDGSSITLNTQSSVQIDYSSDLRHIALANGEALFNVERNTDRPFVVETQYGEVIVTGTVFNVISDSIGARVFVVSGTVDVKPRAGALVTLIAGQSFLIDADGYGGSVALFDPNDVLAWREGKARFRNIPLSAVVKELNRYFDRPIQLDDPALLDLPVTGEFDVNDQQTAINALVVAFTLEQHPEPARILLRAANRP